jgi:hypothetical protein
LWKHSFNFSCSCYSKSIFFWQFIHTKNGNNILEWFVILNKFLYSSCSVIMTFSYDNWI